MTSMQKIFLLYFNILSISCYLIGQTCCPEITKSSISAGPCVLVNGGNCNVCKDADVKMSIESGNNLPSGGQVSWYYSTTSGFNPALGQGTLIGNIAIPNTSCDNASSVKFNEIMVKPLSNDDDMTSPTTGEWIELIGPPGTDLGCYIISDGDWAITIPPGYSIPGDGLFVIGFTATAGSEVDLDVAGCGCTTGNINKVLTLDNAGEWLVMFDGFSTIDALQYGSPSLFNTFPFGDLIAAGKIPGADLIGCVQNYTPGFPSFTNFSPTTPAGQTYSRKPDFSGGWAVACATIGKCNSGGKIFPLDLNTNFSGSVCNQTIYLRGLVTPKPTGCSNLLTPQYSIFVSCPVTNITKKLCSFESILVNGNVYDINNPTGQEVIVGGSYIGCDSTVNVNLSFNPEVSSTISGDFTICQGQSVSIPVNFTGTAPYTFTYEINGFFGNVITTSANPYILKLTPNNSIIVTLSDVFDKNNCSGKVSGISNIEVDAPKASLSDIKLKACEGDTVLIPIVLNGYPDFKFTHFLNGKPQPEISTSKNVYFLPVVVNGNTIVGLKEMTDDQGCMAKITGQDTILVSTKIKIQNLVETCYPGNTYDVSFNLSGGDPKTWTIIGAGTLKDSVFTSNSMMGGTTYQFIIKDSTGCSIDTISNNIKCNCFNSAGKMDQTTLHACIDGNVQATYDATGQSLGANDIVLYILHENSGNSPGKIWAQNTSPIFGFVTGMTPEVTYYISAIVGKENPPGSIDLTDECLQTAIGTPVVFHDFPTVSTPLDSKICVGDCIDLNSTLFGNGPFDVNFKLTTNLGTQNLAANGTGSNITYNYCPPINNGQGFSTYTITQIKDKYCTNNMTDDVNIFVGTPTINNLKKDLCIGQTLIVNGNVYSETNPNGIETLPGGNYNGCDSTIVISLNFVQTVVENLNKNICPGTSIVINGTVFDANNTSGSFNFPGGSTAGCDSVLNVKIGFYSINTGQLTKTLCNGESITINGKVYDVNNPSGFENLAGQGWNGCDSIVQIQLTVLPPIFLLYKDTLCKGETLLVNGTTYDFSKPAGLEIFKNGSYTGCDSTVQIQLLFNSEVNATISGPASICASEPVEITFNFSEPGLYDVVYNDGLSGNKTLTGISDGYKLNLGMYASASTVSLVSVTPIDNNCNVILGPALKFTIGTLLADILTNNNYNGYDVSCQGAEDGSAIVLPTNGTAPYTYLWSNGQTNSSINQIAAGNYSVTVSDSKACSVVKTISLSEPKILKLNASSTGAGCDGNIGGQIVISELTGGVDNYTYTLNGSTPQTIASGQIIGNLSAGNYLLVITDANNCQTSELVTIAQGNANNLWVDAGPDLILEANKQWGLAVKTNFIPTQIAWNPPSGLDCASCLNPVVKVDTSTTYTLTLTDDKGCTTSDTININILDPDIIFIPNVFSPNGDGINDKLLIFASDQVKSIKMFEVFDRWGEKLYSALDMPLNDPEFGWDGKLKGQKANEGVYVYYVLVELNNGKQRLFKGDLTLLR